MMTRAEHLEYAKRRALAYLPDDLTNASASFISDLDAHPELADHPVHMLFGMHMLGGLLNERTCRDLITGTR